MKGRTKTYKCDHCHTPFEARVADRNRGWARFHSKSCKAKKQEKQTGQHQAFLHREEERNENYGHPFESGPDGHGQW